jgi:hypothetical protein
MPTKQISLTEYRSQVLEHVRAFNSSLHWLRSVCPSICFFPSKWALLETCLSIAMESQHQLYLEFGVFEAASINHIARFIPREIVHGFDSFRGLPEDWRFGFREGTFALSEAPNIEHNVRLHVGLFKDTLPPFLIEHPGTVSLAHIDCDLYSSTRTVLSGLEKRIVKGTVLCFDELLFYPGWKSGEYLALAQFLERTQRSVNYIGFGLQQVAVQFI